MNTKKLVLIALFIALSFVGAQIKLVYSIALDALPAFLAAAMLGPIAGGLVGFLGHLLTALTSGFPFSIPIHLVVATSMAIICWIFGKGYGKLPLILNVGIAIFLNGVVATLLAVVAMQWFGIVPQWQAMFATLVGPLSLASAVNVGLAGVLSVVLSKRGALKQI
jgi:uncharacterized membrane protein